MAEIYGVMPSQFVDQTSNRTRIEFETNDLKFVDRFDGDKELTLTSADIYLNIKLDSLEINKLKKWALQQALNDL